jgi:hypothetical protein
MPKKMTPAQDARYDKAHGIAPGSPRDNALDKKRGLPVGPGKGKK